MHKNSKSVRYLTSISFYVPYSYGRGVYMTLFILMGITLTGLVLSLIKSRERTGKSIKMALGMGKSMVWQLLSLLGLIALILAFLPEQRIADFLGEARGIMGSINGALIGSLTILPGVIAFPLAKQLSLTGASLSAVAAFITTLTMVGMATAPMEYQSFGLKFTLLRNSLSFLFALIIAAIMGALL
jgi:uncharacterized membrane protein YraQ (UPF0718 family)